MYSIFLTALAIRKPDIYRVHCFVGGLLFYSAAISGPMPTMSGGGKKDAVASRRTFSANWQIRDGQSDRLGNRLVDCCWCHSGRRSAGSDCE